MNRRITGIAAWCALGLIVAIPSTDVLLKNVGGDHADVAQTASNDAKKGFGPDKPGTDERPIIDMSATDFSSVLQPSLEEAPGQVTVAEVDKSTKAPGDLPSIVPLSVPQPEDVEIAAAPEPEIVPVAPLDLDVGAVPESPDVGPVIPTVEENIEVAAIDPVDVPEFKTELAPVPMPAPARSRTATTLRANRLQDTRLVPTLEDDVRSSVNVIETARRPVVVIDAPVNEPFFGDNPRYRNGRRLDSFSSDEIARTDDASDSQFYELWASENRPSGFRRQGSFSDQLPARRGSAVRLDLLQNN